MFRHFLEVKGNAAHFLCPFTPFSQQLCPVFNDQDIEFYPEGLYVTSKEKAADVLGASIDTLDTWIAKGLIHPEKRGRNYFFSIAGLTAALNYPQIRDFLKKKATAAPVAKEKKSNHAANVRYWLLPQPGGKFMYVRIRYKGEDIVWFCLPSVADDPKELEDFISDVITLYRKTKSMKPGSCQLN
jgi:hypothetical protein